MTQFELLKIQILRQSLLASCLLTPSRSTLEEDGRMKQHWREGDSECDTDPTIAQSTPRRVLKPEGLFRVVLTCVVMTFILSMGWLLV